MRSLRTLLGSVGIFRLTGFVVAAVYTISIVRVVARVSVFSGDDITTSWQGRNIPLEVLLVTPIDVHTVPLHRVVTYALAQLAPLDDGAALAVMLAFHVASVWLLYRALEAIQPSASNAFVVLCYATFVHLGPLFSWWVAAVHRLPYLVCLGGAVWAYAVYRKRPSAKGAALIVFCLVVGLGFFEKAVFIAFVLLGLEAALTWSDPAPRQVRGRLAALHALLVALCVAYLFIWRRIVDPGMMGPVVTNVGFLGEYLRLSWVALISAIAGQVDSGFWLGASSLVTICLATCLLRPANVVTCCVGGLVISASLIVTGMSAARMSMWGFFWTRSWRYYPDVMYILAVFVGIALSRAGTRLVQDFPLAPIYRTLAGSVALVALAVLSRTSYLHGSRAVMADSNLSLARAYLDNVRSGLRRLEMENAELVFVDGKVPSYLQLFQDERARHRILLGALGKTVRVADPGVGVYRIEPDGRIVEALADLY